MITDNVSLNGYLCPIAAPLSFLVDTLTISNILVLPLLPRTLKAACLYWEVPPEYFMERSKRSLQTHRVAILVYLIRNRSGIHWRDLAYSFGYKSHQPVIRLYSIIDSEKDINPETKRELIDIGLMIS